MLSTNTHLLGLKAHEVLLIPFVLNAQFRRKSEFEWCRALHKTYLPFANYIVIVVDKANIDVGDLCRVSFLEPLERGRVQTIFTVGNRAEAWLHSARTS